MGIEPRPPGDQTRSPSWAQITQRQKNEAVREWIPFDLPLGGAAAQITTV